MAIASLSCSIGGAVLGFLCCFVFGIAAVVGIVLGFIARSQIQASNGAEQGDGMALAGIIVGFIAVGVVLLGLVAFAGITALG